MNYKALEEKKNDLISRAEEILSDAELNKRALTEEEIEEMGKIQADVNGIKKALKISEEISEKEERTIKEEQTVEKEKQERTAEEVAEMETRAFANYIRGAVLNERIDYNLTEAANGAVIPTTIVNKIIDTVYDVCPILARSTKYNVKGKIEIPKYTEATHAITVAYASEFEELAGSVGSFTNIELDGYLAGALALISKSLINKSDFNLTNFVVNHMAEAISRFIEKELLNGTENKVAGLTGVTASITAEGSTAITSDEVVRLKDKVKDVYQPNAIWIMSSATRTALRLLKDTRGQYILNDDITSPFGTTLLGKPVYVSDNMSDMGAGKTAIYYGDMSGLATKFTEEMNIQVLREKYATQHAIGVVGWVEFDSKVENTQKIAKLVMHA